MPIDPNRTAAALNGGTVVMTILPAPRPRVKRITEEKPTYLTPEGEVVTTKTNTRARRHKRNPAGQALYIDDKGETVNRTSRDGTVVYPAAEETYTQSVTTVVPVMAKDGVTPVLDYADVRATLRVVDTKGRDFPEADTFEADELTEDQRDRLSAIAQEILAARAAKNGIHPTLEAARAAGVITD